MHLRRALAQARRRRVDSVQVSSSVRVCVCRSCVINFSPIVAQPVVVFVDVFRIVIVLFVIVIYVPFQLAVNVCE